MKAQDLEQIVKGAANGDWSWFESADPSVKRAMDLKQARDAEDQKTIASAWARFADSPDGRKALERLFDTTLRRAVYFATLGLEPSSMAVFGAFREGQNSVAHEIARQIGLAENEAVKPRDV
ncbi:hypothetical protein FJU08_01340 [Martelella alba]|uniref:Uncharacterized protein n=1 Tax=Martelella alba TaxID=2590451 RepID=A0A506UIU4_9HYPH|nr:hypothetical protein [Martelella alba]TPW33237.1 hypothetical protein FJU08_01340 [Martelella alba]